MGRKYLVGTLGVFLLWFVAASTFALPTLIIADKASAAVVSSIDVQGNQRVDNETIIAYLLIEPGRSFSAGDVDESLKALFETGLFSDVRISQRSSVLVVAVVENPVINRVVFEGNRKFKDDQLAGALQSRARGIYTRATVQSDTQRILEVYRRNGRFQASVEPQIIELPKNRINLVFVISEGPETGVSRINFIGNKTFSDGKLRDVIDTSQKGLFGWLHSRDTYDPDRLASDEEKIRRFYLERGFADFQMISAVADLDRERNVFFITFTLEEGERYRFGTLEVDSIIPGVESESLGRHIVAREGRIYSSLRVEQSMEAITVELARSGYAFAQVRPRIDRDFEAKIVSVVFVVDEGPRAYVERIEIRGNTRTRDYVIRREFDIAEGDAFNRVMVDRAERRIRNLRYFKSVRVTTEQGSAPDRVVIVVAVEEQATGDFTFGAGYSTQDGIIGDISIRERNFLGRGYNVSFAIGVGDSTRTYNFGFTDPYFLGRRISAGFNIFRRDLSATSFRSYDSLTNGGVINFGFPITENFVIRVGYSLRDEDTTVPGYDPTLGFPAGCPSTISLAICQSIGDVLISSAVYSLTYDSIDNRLDPKSGIFARFSQDIAGLGGDISYVHSRAIATVYRELIPDRSVVGFLKVQGAHITGLGSDKVRIVDAIFKGGEAIRGFENSGFGPRDATTGDALGGKVFVAGTAEVQFPMPLLPREVGFKGAFFADAGTLYDTDAGLIPGVIVQDNASLRSSVGGSVLWASPLGPIRADFAYVLSSESYDRTEVFRIGGGTTF